MKKLFTILTTVFFLTCIYAQEDEPQKRSLLSYSADFMMEFEPAVYINPESTLVSAPSPVVYPISIGFLWPDDTVFAVQPTLSFFMMQHLFYNNKALPAEIENRTTTTLSFMVTIPLVFSIYLTKSRFQIYGGPGILARFGFLSPGVNDSDTGWTGSAGRDADSINQWFWNGMRCFYMNLGGSWLYNLPHAIKAGPVINCCIPVGGLISDQSIQGMMISIGIKICR